MESTLTFLQNKAHAMNLVSPIEDVRVVDADGNVNVRSNAGATYSILFTLEPGTTMTVNGINDGGEWLHIVCWKGFGWIYEPLTQVVEG